MEEITFKRRFTRTAFFLSWIAVLASFIFLSSVSAQIINLQDEPDAITIINTNNSFFNSTYQSFSYNHTQVIYNNYNNTVDQLINGSFFKQFWYNHTSAGNPNGYNHTQIVYQTVNWVNISTLNGSIDFGVNQSFFKRFWYNYTLIGFPTINIFNQDLNTTNNVTFENVTARRVFIGDNPGSPINQHQVFSAGNVDGNDSFSTYRVQGITMIFGAFNVSTGSPVHGGFLGTFNNQPFHLRQNNLNRLNVWGLSMNTTSNFLLNYTNLTQFPKTRHCFNGDACTSYITDNSSSLIIAVN